MYHVHNNANGCTPQQGARPFTPPGPLTTAVLLVVFNRPDTTRQVFEAVRRAGPPRLYVAADGPRPQVAGEAEQCEQVRAIVTAVDWQCEVQTLFRDSNLGCKHAVSGGISWFFEQEKEGIILEDDCLPSQSFFWFCQELLDRYRDDPRVNAIGGRNRHQDILKSKCSYFFSKYNIIWGWATWRKAWQGYDPNIEIWPEIKRSADFKKLFDTPLERWHFETIWDMCHSGLIDTWDYQWFLHRLLDGGLSAIAAHNLIANIGLGHSAGAHTAAAQPDATKLREMPFPLQHPAEIHRDKAAEAILRSHRLGSLKARCKTALRRMLSRTTRRP
jgi:hypothetical protein